MDNYNDDLDDGFDLYNNKRGPLPRTPDATRNQLVQVYLLPDEKELVVHIAKERCMSVSAYIRSCIMNAELASMNRELLNTLRAEGAGYRFGVDEVMGILNCPRPMARRIIGELEHMGLVLPLGNGINGFILSDETGPQGVL